jgi:hypothetical protein
MAYSSSTFSGYWGLIEWRKAKGLADLELHPVSGVPSIGFLQWSKRYYGSAGRNGSHGRHEAPVRSSAPGAVAEAVKRFRELTGSGFAAAKRPNDGRSAVVKSFDPTAEEAVHTTASRRMMSALVCVDVCFAMLGGACLIVTTLVSERARRTSAQAQQKALALFWPSTMSAGPRRLVPE